MLSKLGKLSAVVVMACGATLLQSEPASAAAASMEPCTASQESAACTSATTYWYQLGEGWMCGQYEEGTCTTDGENLYFQVDYHYSQDPCPAVQPC